MDGAFVIQQHETVRGVHFDLMLEQPAALTTFQLPCPPGRLPPGGDCEAVRLADHRKLYLSYEGPISGGRGTVRIVDRGRYAAETADPDRWTLRLAGEQAVGRFELRRLNGDRWELRRQEER